MAKNKSINLKDREVSLEDANKAFELAKKAIKKKYGEVISVLDDHSDMKIPTVSTGCLSLDLALGCGGMGLGRIYEIFGPSGSGKSTLAINTIIQAQRRGLKCCYIDAEHAVDPKLFRTYGVNTKELELVQGYDGEENLDILERFIKTGAFSVAVVDSVSALIPRDEAEADIDKDSMALQARLMSKALRKITPIANKTGTLLIFINQLRMKVGSYGCFHYDTLVNFTDGRSIPIGKVVDEKINGNVWSLNKTTGEIEEKSIIDWHDNGIVESNEDFVHIQSTSIDGKGRFGFTCTTNHEILTKNGWKKAENLSFADKLVSKCLNTVNGSYGDFINGCLVGDSGIYIRCKNTGSLILQNNENKEYMNWKLDKLSKFLKFNEFEIGEGKYRYNSEFTYELAKIKKELFNRDPMHLLNNYSDLGFAIWVMDDGNLDLNGNHRRYGISIKRFKNNIKKLEEIKNKFNNLGFECSYDIKSGYIRFKSLVTDKIASTICKYIPKCMQYKLPSEYRNKYEDFELNNHPILIKDYVDIKEIRFASDRQMRKNRKFDISIEDNFNYMVGGKYNGVIVHNSPVTTTGGESLAFYSTGRISVKGPEAKSRRLLDDDGEVIGHRAEFEINKNKLAAPFKKAEVKLIYGKGYDAYWEILDIATSLGVVDKSGAWYKYNGENFAQGELNAVAFFKNPENTELYEKIKDEVIDSVGLKSIYESHGNPGPKYS